MPTRKLAIAAGVVVLAAVAAFAAIAFFNARDDSTVSHDEGPGRARAAGGPAVRTGNVLIVYRAAGSGTSLKRLAEDEAGPPEAAIVAAGQAVLVRRDAGLDVPIRALTSQRSVDVNSAADPALRQFVEFWLGRE